MTNPVAEQPALKKNSSGLAQWMEKASSWFVGRSQPQQGSITLIRAVPKAAMRLSPEALRALIEADVVIYGRQIDYHILSLAVGERSLVYLATPSLEAAASQIAFDYARRGQTVVRLVGIEDADQSGALSDEMRAQNEAISLVRLF
jgi:siroheme synthase